MPFNMLLLPLIGGFIFIRLWNRTRYHAIRADKDRLLIHASIAGLVFLIIAYTFHLLSAAAFPCAEFSFCISSWWKRNIPFEYSDVSFIALLIGTVSWYPLNFLFNEEAEKERVIRDDADPLELLLKRAQKENITVSLTMTNDKVYVGFVTHTFNPATPTKTISLFPIQSGYRDSVTKKINFTVNYSNTYNEINQEIDILESEINELEENRSGVLQNADSEQQTDFDEEIKRKTDEKQQLKNTVTTFQLVIPVDQIASINLYSEGVQERYFLPTPTDESQ